LGEPGRVASLADGEAYASTRNRRRITLCHESFNVGESYCHLAECVVAPSEVAQTLLLSSQIDEPHFRVLIE
jgi:hypothetical protein